MPDEPQEPLTEEELEQHEAEQLPDREVMSVIIPGDPYQPLPEIVPPLAPPLPD
jgi:hypothetical protein